MIIIYTTFYYEGKSLECLGTRTGDTTKLLEIHSIAMLSGFLLPILSIFRIVRVVIPYFIDLTTSYLIHRIGIFVQTFLNYQLNDVRCSKDGEMKNGVNGYSYAIVFFFLVFVRLLNSNDNYPQYDSNTISLQFSPPTYIQNRKQLFYQSVGPFSYRYSCSCQNYLKNNEKCLYHSTVYIILSIYILSGSIGIGHILVHGFANVTQILFGMCLAYIMIFLFDFILYFFRPLVKAIVLITCFYIITFVAYIGLNGEIADGAFYHVICAVDLCASIVLHYKLNTKNSKKH
ncbi:hypothetical protein EIN_163920 [Entamoeba invadens IP1]|uniref:Uncharacterized protein n=1 Tax=Entamoeba invadens IP1 TaxID=370355 RepID=A0A0A1U472_ENTIV|nr:hypothetical protein EIN_163920 [Entamoeba invadens IP1]ELP89022.1 hypothetical protein EIN_163920 [Entamoeba invadens IP1]|eukprot:XP_004255793.1 hypothetical protein EIN_163920 [Entamoeba invadens IP1]